MGTDEAPVGADAIELPTDDLLRSALSSMGGVSIVIFDRAMRIQGVHGGAIKRHEPVPALVVGRLAPDTLPSATWLWLGPLYARALAGETVTVPTAPHDGASGYETTFSPLYRGERLIGAIATSRDVPERAAGDEHERRPNFERSFTEAPVAMLLLRGRRIERANAAVGELLGLSPADLVGRDQVDFVHPGDRARSVSALKDLAGGTPMTVQDRRFVTAAGDVLHLSLRYSILGDDEDGPPLVLLHLLDRTAQVRAATQREAAHTDLQLARRQLSAAKSQLQSILDNAPISIYMRDLQQRWILANPEVCRFIGVTEQTLIGRTIAQTHPPGRAAVMAAEDQEVIEHGPRSFDTVIPDSRTGEEKKIWTMKFPVHGTAGEIVGVGGMSLDVTQREQTQRELAASRMLFETAFATAPVGMLISRAGDDTGSHDVEQCNAAFAAMLGHTPEDLVGRSTTALVHPDDQPLRAEMIANLLAGRPAAGELRLKHRDGRDIWVLMAPGTTLGSDGERLFVVQAVDISERKQLEHRLRHVADHDLLTGLVSRRRFEEELDRELSRVARHGHPAALLLVDLDGFKRVNDTLGHAAGDQLLNQIAVALRSGLRDSDILARIGGDEFAIILPEADLADGCTTGRRVAEAVRVHGQVGAGADRVSVTASVGVTMLRARMRIDGQQLLIEADNAMYEAKKAGGDRVAASGAPPQPTT